VATNPSAGQTGNCGSTLEVLPEESSRFDRSSASVTAQDVDPGEIVAVDGAISVTILWVSLNLNSGGFKIIEFNSFAHQSIALGRLYRKSFGPDPIRRNVRP
jgi:hypothetical protein